MKSRTKFLQPHIAKKKKKWKLKFRRWGCVPFPNSHLGSTKTSSEECQERCGVWHSTSWGSLLQFPGGWQNTETPEPEAKVLLTHSTASGTFALVLIGPQVPPRRCQIGSGDAVHMGSLGHEEDTLILEPCGYYNGPVTNPGKLLTLRKTLQYYLGHQKALLLTLERNSVFLCQGC